MTATERKLRAEARAAAKIVCEECELVGTHAASCSKYVAPAVERNLDDPAVQEAILDPEPKPLTIGGEPVSLFVLPAFEQRQLLCSFIPRMTRTAVAAGDLAPGETRLDRYSDVIANDRALSEQLAAFIARAEHKPDAEVDEAQLAERAGVIFNTALPVEFIAAFMYVSIINEALTGGPKPKTGALAKS